MFQLRVSSWVSFSFPGSLSWNGGSVGLGKSKLWWLSFLLWNKGRQKPPCSVHLNLAQVAFKASSSDWAQQFILDLGNSRYSPHSPQWSASSTWTSGPKSAQRHGKSGHIRLKVTKQVSKWTLSGYYAGLGFIWSTFSTGLSSFSTKMHWYGFS